MAQAFLFYNFRCQVFALATGVANGRHARGSKPPPTCCLSLNGEPSLARDGNGEATFGDALSN